MLPLGCAPVRRSAQVIGGGFTRCGALVAPAATVLHLLGIGRRSAGPIETGHSISPFRGAARRSVPMWAGNGAPQLVFIVAFKIVQLWAKRNANGHDFGNRSSFGTQRKAGQTRLAFGTASDYLEARLLRSAAF